MNQHEEALKWANANPSDPDAELVRTKALRAIGGESFQGPPSLLQVGGEIKAEANPLLAKTQGSGDSFAQNFKQGLLTNEKPRGVGGAIGRSALPTIGAIGMFPAGGGLASIPAAGLGAAAGESARQALVTYNNPVLRAKMSGGELAKDVLYPIAAEGIANAAGEGAGKLIAKGGGMAFDAFAPSLTTLFTKVPEKTTKQLVAGGLKGAKTVEQAGKDYGAATGLEGLKSAIDDTPATWMAIAKDAQQKLANGTVTPQEALAGIQALNKVKQAGKLGQDVYGGTRAEQTKLGEEFAEYLETQFPGFREANQDYAKAMGKEKFNSWFPRNLNGSPDVARSLAGLATGTFPLMSPKIAKAGIDFVREVGPGANYVMRRGVSPIRAGLDERSQPNSKEERR
jgi:hypothetical protein